MTEMEVLKRRRELVVLSAELQRATLVRRLGRIQANPAQRAIGYAAKVASRRLQSSQSEWYPLSSMRFYKKCYKQMRSQDPICRNLASALLG